MASTKQHEERRGLQLGKEEIIKEIVKKIEEKSPGKNNNWTIDNEHRDELIKAINDSINESREVGRGAEAIIYADDERVYKYRPKKGYRHPSLDHDLRKRRTRREAKVLLKIESLKKVCAPRLFFHDDELIIMSLVKGPLFKKVLIEDYERYKTEMIKVGHSLGVLHNNDIVHGDLTTSNIIISEIRGKPQEKLPFFIDFGLSTISKKLEDQAVDIHLLRQAIESKHFEHHEELFSLFRKGYEEARGIEAKKVFERLIAVEKRGKNKKKE